MNSHNTAYRESRIPACTFPASDFIREELSARGWTVDDFASQSGLSARESRDVLNGGEMTPAIAMCIARAFGTSHEMWIGLSGKDA